MDGFFASKHNYTFLSNLMIGETALEELSGEKIIFETALGVRFGRDFMKLFPILTSYIALLIRLSGREGVRKNE